MHHTIQLKDSHFKDHIQKVKEEVEEIDFQVCDGSAIKGKCQSPFNIMSRGKDKDKDILSLFSDSEGSGERDPVDHVREIRKALSPLSDKIGDIIGARKKTKDIDWDKLDSLLRVEGKEGKERLWAAIGTPEMKEEVEGIDLALIAMIGKALGDEDWEFPLTGIEGFALGVTVQLPPNSSLLPTLKRKKKRDTPETIVLGGECTASGEAKVALLAKIKEEIGKGYLEEVPLEEPFITRVKVSMIKKVKEDKVKWRMIEDYQRNGVNWASQLGNSIALPGLEDMLMAFEAATSLGSGPVSVAILDIKEAYRLLKVKDEEARKFCRIEWTDEAGKKRAAIRKVLMFGHQNAPEIFVRVASIVQRSARKLLSKTAFISSFIDDYALISFEENFREDLSIFIALTSISGISWGWDKAQVRENPFDYIGFCFVLRKNGGLRVSLPPAKVADIITLARQEKWSVKNFRSLVGKLSHACTLNPSWRLCLAPAYRVLGPIDKLKEDRNRMSIILNSWMRRGGYNWRALLARTVNSTMLEWCRGLGSIAIKEVIIGSDASQSQIGAWCLLGKDVHYLVARCEHLVPLLNAKGITVSSINTLEAFGFVLGIFMLDEVLRTFPTRVCWVTDNRAAGHAMQAMRSRRSVELDMIGRAFGSRLRRWLYIPSGQNILADNLSRIPHECNECNRLTKPFAEYASGRIGALNSRLVEQVIGTGATIYEMWRHLKVGIDDAPASGAEEEEEGDSES